MTSKRPTRAEKLGVDDERYALMLEDQDGHCALCPSLPGSRRLHVDHNHETGEVRGLLCHRCNRVLQTWVTPQWCIDAANYLWRYAR